MICIIAGEGNLPVRLCEQLKLDSIKFIILTFENVKHSLEGFEDLIYKFKLGEIKSILSLWTEMGVDEIVMCGKIKFPGFSNIKFDSYGLKFLSRFVGLKKGGDDSILSSVINIIEEHGIKVSAIQDIIPNLIAKKKDEFISTIFNKKENYIEDSKIGFRILDKISEFDIGQGLVIQEKRVIAIEAAEGTDEMIKRSQNYIIQNQKKPILVKTAKKNQERRSDMPVIGPETISSLANSGFFGISIREREIIMVDKDKIFKIAKEKGISIFVFDSNFSQD